MLSLYLLAIGSHIALIDLQGVRDQGVETVDNTLNRVNFKPKLSPLPIVLGRGMVHKPRRGGSKAKKAWKARKRSGKRGRQR